MNQEIIGILDQTIILLEQHREDELQLLLDPLHSADLAEILEELEEEHRARVLRLLSPEIGAEIIAELAPADQAIILESLSAQHASEILHEMSADDVADMMGELSPLRAGQFLKLLNAADATQIQRLLGFRPDTAGGIMTPEYMSLRAELTAQGAIDEMRRMAPDVETAYYVYVISEEGQLVGVLSLRELIVASPAAPIQGIMRSQVVSVNVNEDQEEVARVVKKYNLLAVPVVDDQGVLRGIVTVDDVMDVLEEEATEDIYRAAGVSDQEQDLDPQADIWVAVRSRLPWLLGLLFLSLVSGKVIEHYSGLIATVGVLSVFITTMAGGSGNAATQALTVVVRGMATGEIDPSQVWRVVWREVRVGVAIGFISAIVLGITATLWHGDWSIGLIAGSAIFVNLILAKAAGASVPILMKWVGLDPAVASGPFIATITDTTSMLIYFGIAAAVIGYVTGG